MVGDGGTVLSSRAGGRWSPQPIGPAMIVGDDEGTVLSTPDGGATWVQYFDSPERDAAARPQPQQR
ncbi:hypothetical protein ACWD25_08845 [Streptomyces sp. NPDC002920]